MAMSFGDVKKAETLIEEGGQIAAAMWTHVAGLGSEPDYSRCRSYRCGPEGRA